LKIKVNFDNENNAAFREGNITKDGRKVKTNLACASGEDGAAFQRLTRKSESLI
jgi:hypothetical protein